MTEDMGLTPSEQASIGASYLANMAVIYDEVLKRGMFSWQQVRGGGGRVCRATFVLGSLKRQRCSAFLWAR